MNYLRKYYSKLFFKQWTIGFLEDDIRNIIRERKTDLSFTWLHLNDVNVSYADPFFLKYTSGEINVLFESFTTDKYDGKISLINCSNLSKLSAERVVLKSTYHLSYPSVFKENGKNYVFPENALSGSLWCYEYDENSSLLTSKIEVLTMPILDATILKRDGKYWMFGTLLGEFSHSKLYIFYSDNLAGPYLPHPGNPVKDSLVGSRPAGGFIEVDGNIFRPAQNCEHYYGESVTINKVITLNTKEYSEEPYMVLNADKKGVYNFGIHTINAVDNLIVADGLRGHFQPFQQLVRTIGRKFDNGIS